MMCVLSQDIDFQKNPQIKILRTSDNAYPSRVPTILGKHAPKELFIQGNEKLFEKVAIGFCGSRHASDKGLETAKDCTAQMVLEGIVIISGNASGIDFTAHRTALEKGGCSIFVLPEGIDHFKIKKALEDVWDWERVLIVSQFPRNAIWQSYRAMERNSLIIALSNAMVVIEAGEKGGTLDAGTKTLKLSVPLYVATYENMPETAPGNLMLLNKGAKQLLKGSKSNQASIKKLVAEATSFNPEKIPGEQLGFI